MSETLPRWDGVSIETARDLLSEYADEIKRLQTQIEMLRADLVEVLAAHQMMTTEPDGWQLRFVTCECLACIRARRTLNETGV